MPTPSSSFSLCLTLSVRSVFREVYCCLKQVAKLHETSLHDLPGWVGTKTENVALAFVFAANRCRKVSHRKERVAVGKAHLFRVEVAAGKVRAADAVVIL